MTKHWTDFFGIQNGGGDLELGYEYPRLYSTTNSWLADTWHHAALTYNSGMYQLYVNGVHQASLYRLDPLLGDLEEMYFSHSLTTPWNPPFWYQQRLDEIAIYDRALTAEEVAGRAGSCEPADTVLPTITINAPAATSYLLNETVAADYGCADMETGVESCVGPAAPGTPIATASARSHEFTVQAVDFAGNTATRSVTYNVNYKVCLRYDPAKVHKQGSSIPIKIQLCDNADRNVSGSSIALTARSITQTSTTTFGPLEDSGHANPDNNFRYESTFGGYIYNLSTKPLTTGRYTLDFTVAENSTLYRVPFQVQ